MNSINWGPLFDCHVSGDSPIGKLWIRVNRQNQVTGVYTMFGKTRKLVPEGQEEWTLEDAKVVAELALLEEIDFRKQYVN